MTGPQKIKLLRRRDFVAIASSVYKHPDFFPDLPGVTDEVAVLRGWLCDGALDPGVRFTHRYVQLADNPSKQQIRDALESPPEDDEWRYTDAAVVFVTGHARQANQSEYVVLRETRPDRPTSTALRAGELVGWLRETGIEHLLLVFDLCHSGATAADTVRLDADFPPTWLVLASATKNQAARVGALTDAIQTFLDTVRSDQGGQYGQGPYLQPGDFLEELQELLPADQSLCTLTTRLPDLRVGSPCLPNPRHRAEEATTLAGARRDLALPRADLEAHWGPRSRGVSEDADPGWLFTGRTDLMEALIMAATGPAGTVLVTGGAGSGKSAALARLVTLSDPGFLATYPDQVHRIDPELRPPVHAVDVAVLATGKTAAEIMDQIAAAVGAYPDRRTATATPHLDDARTAWQRWLSSRTTPVTVVVDALDEASQPGAVLHEVLRHLQPADRQGPGVRLLVGVRSPTGNPTGAPSLADIAEQTLTGCTRIPVDQSPWWHRDDVTAYVTSLLQTTPASPYGPPCPTGDDATRPAARAAGGQQALQQVTAVVAAAVADAARTSYLLARIAGASLTHADHVVDVHDPIWRASLATGVDGVFRADLQSSIPAGDWLRAVHLLRAVAFAYGRGLPWRKIWPRVACAVADEPDIDDPPIYGDADIAWLLNTRLAAYLVTDLEDDVTVYRLFHDALSDTLRTRWRDLLTPQPTTPDRS